MTSGADPIRATKALIDHTDYHVYTDTIPATGEYPAVQVKAAGGPTDASYSPVAEYSVDILTFGSKEGASATEARRLSFRIHNMMKDARPRRIDNAGYFLSAVCQLPPTQIFDSRDNRHYYAQSWWVELGDVDNIT